VVGFRLRKHVRATFDGEEMLPQTEADRTSPVGLQRKSDTPPGARQTASSNLGLSDTLTLSGVWVLSNL
jgi:hypothetical protein